MKKKLVRFSQYYKMKKEQEDLEFVDIFVDDDIQLFLDPGKFLCYGDEFSTRCREAIVDYFSQLLMFIKAGKRREALVMLSNLNEPKETHLGYSFESVSGKAIGSSKAFVLYRQLLNSRAVQTGILRDLEDSALLVEGIGIDCISDITTIIIKQMLIEFTEQVCEKYGISTKPVICGRIWTNDGNMWKKCIANLPCPDGNAVILVPKKYVVKSLFVNINEFYNHEILDYYMEEKVKTNIELVRVLKNGEKRCSLTKKELKKEYKVSKDLVYDFCQKNPQALEKYKKRIKYKVKNEDDIIEEAIQKKAGNI